jgi:hypothetical protein
MPNIEIQNYKSGLNIMNNIVKIYEFFKLRFFKTLKRSNRECCNNTSVSDIDGFVQLSSLWWANDIANPKRINILREYTIRNREETYICGDQNGGNTLGE